MLNIIFRWLSRSGKKLFSFSVLPISRLLRARQWGSCLSWAIRSRDIKTLSALADQVVLRCANDDFSSITVVEHFTEVMLLSSSFAFLHRYYNFRKLLESDQKVKAAELLVCHMF